MSRPRAAYLIFLAPFALFPCGCAVVGSPAVPTPSPISTPTTSPTKTRTSSIGQHPHSTTVRVETPAQSSRSVRLDYLLYLPDSYGSNPAEKFPMILFLHGRGERGNDLEMLKKHPLPKLVQLDSHFPFIVVSPQHPLDGLWWSDLIDPLMVLLDQIEGTYSVDSERVYLTGLSMGGFGAWEFASRYPDRFAAVVPIAGGYVEGSREVPGNICHLRNVPIWAFHGTADTFVAPFQSQVMVDALRECGGNVRLTLYDRVDHEGSWTRAYADPELYRWLLAQRGRTK